MTPQKKTPDPRQGQAHSKQSDTHHNTPLPSIEPVARELLGEENKALSKKGELRFGTNGSLAVNLDEDTWYSHEEEIGGGVLDLISYAAALPERKDQLAWLEDRGFKEKREDKPKAKRQKLVEVTRYRYTDANGKCRFWVARFEPKTFRQGHMDDRGRFVPGVKGIDTHIPYHLHKIAANPESEVIAVEGEKDVHRLEELGLLATCNAGGAGRWSDAHSKHLSGRRVVILPDNDEPGRDHARKARASLEAHGAEVKVILLPDLPEKGDVSDWLDAGHSREELLALIAGDDHELPEPEEVQGEEVQAEPDEDGGKDRESQADKIVGFVRARCDLSHDDNDAGYARHRGTGEVWALGSKAFRNWLTADFYVEHEKAVKDQSLREARMTLEGLAMQDHRPVHIRVAGGSGDYWLDLGISGSNRAVRLRAGRWELVEAEMMFCRSDSAQPLPDPERNGDIRLLWRIANIPEESRLLVVAWLVECLRPDTPFPVMELLGEQGSGKTGTSAALRRLIDPNAADNRGVPKSAEDLFVSGGINHLITAENVSHLPAPLQDAMCIVSTGGGFARRKLYTDAEESVISLKRPILINGVVASVTQQDLVSRTVTVELPVLTNAQSQDKLEAEFERNRPRIIGSLLDIAARALEILPEMTLPPERRPRLVEFAYLGMAVAKAVGRDPEEFMRQFEAAREDGLERTLEASPVATAIRDWAETHPGEVRDEPAKRWLEILEDFKARGCDAWPKSGKGMGDRMRRAAPALRQLGIECRCLGKTGSYVEWRVGQRKLSESSLQCLEVFSGEGDPQDFKTSKTSYEKFSTPEQANVTGVTQVTDSQQPNLEACPRCAGEGCGYCGAEGWT